MTIKRATPGVASTSTALGRSRKTKEVVVERKEAPRSKKNKGRKEDKKKPEKSLERRIMGKVGGILQEVLGDDDWLDLGAKAISGGLSLAGSILPYAAMLASDNPYHPSCNVPANMRMTRVPRRCPDTGRYLVNNQTTTLRQVHFARQMLDRKRGLQAQAGVPFATDDAITTFSEMHSMQTPTGSNCLVVSGREKIFDLPETATKGQVLLQVVLDMGSGVLKTSRMAQQLALYNRVKQVAVALVYVSGTNYAESGQIGIVGSSDPTRTILAFEDPNARVTAASEYDRNFLPLRLFDNGTFSCPIAAEVKYQDMVPTTNPYDERFVAPGIMEVVCTGSWNETSSPGSFYLEWDSVGIDPTPSPTTASERQTCCSVFRHQTNNTDVVIGVDGQTTNWITNSTNNGPFAPAGPSSSRFSFFDRGMPRSSVASLNDTAWNTGGLAQLGFKYLAFSAAYIDLVCPIGTFTFNFALGHSTGSMSGSFTLASQDTGSVVTSLFASNQIYGTGNIYYQGYTLTVSKSGAIVRLARTTSAAIASTSAYLSMEMFVVKYMPSSIKCGIDFIAPQFRHLINKDVDPLYLMETGPYITDAAEYQAVQEFEKVHGPQAPPPSPVSNKSDFVKTLLETDTVTPAEKGILLKMLGPLSPY